MLEPKSEREQYLEAEAARSAAALEIALAEVARLRQEAQRRSGRPPGHEER